MNSGIGPVKLFSDKFLFFYVTIKNIINYF